MLDIHHKGEAIVGTYTYDTAMSKASKAMQMADEEGFPLRISLQPEEKTDLPF
jgi:ATP-dependent Clp protease adaptor protein ClpS